MPQLHEQVCFGSFGLALFHTLGAKVKYSVRYDLLTVLGFLTTFQLAPWLRMLLGSQTNCSYIHCIHILGPPCAGVWISMARMPLCILDMDAPRLHVLVRASRVQNLGGLGCLHSDHTSWGHGSTKRSRLVPSGQDSSAAINILGIALAGSRHSYAVQTANRLARRLVYLHDPHLRMMCYP